MSFFIRLFVCAVIVLSLVLLLVL